MQGNHLVTGATGFIGGAIVLELLGRTESHIYCTVRDDDPASGRRRLIAGLEAAAKAYGITLPPHAPERLHVIRYDLKDPPPPDGELPAIDIAWHSAASLKHEDRHRDQIYAHNHQGTRHIWTLAKACGARRFNHISTAYVAGSRSGVVCEDPAPQNAVTNNVYEASKIEGETFLLSEEPGPEVRIFRCSIIVGHSKTKAATSFTGLYGFIRELINFDRRVSRKLGRFLAHRSVYFRALAETPLNFLPVDVAADAIVRIGLENTASRIFHIANNTPPLVGPAVSLVFKELGMRAPTFVEDGRNFTSIDEAMDEALEFYSSYLRHPKHFDQTNVAEILGEPLQSAMPLDTFRAYVRWYLDSRTKEETVVSEDEVERSPAELEST